ncbi:MAG: DegT/DnrJ/EryC1/StrS family aminotransferase [bacterium]|nr:DegT/DnrJ/EryC1/StrS family aminotransferase [bacterium]
MPGYELIGKEEQEQLMDIFNTSNGVLFPHGFDALRNNRYRVREFEKKFAEKMGSKYAQAITSGTVAQVVAMLAMGVKPGDEVITQAFTFVATVETIIAIGAVPVIVDVDDTYNMDPKELEKAITSKTKLIVPVHMLGNTAAMDEIMAIAAKHQIAVLEDSCEALGATYNGKFAGTIGHVGIYSLDFGKTITTGEGGMIVTDDETIYKFCKEYHDHGHESNPAFPRGRDTRTMAGMNYRMNEMQGAVGMAQLEKLDTILAANRNNKNYLEKHIQADKIIFRRLTDASGDLSDTLIFNFETQAQALKFVDLYKVAGYGTKNIPDAIDWHFTGTWNHMFADVPRYRDTWKTEWQRSEALLYRSVALPINVKTTQEALMEHVKVINQILDQI